MNNKIDEILKPERVNSTIDFDEVDTLSDLKDVKIVEKDWAVTKDEKSYIKNQVAYKKETLLSSK